MSIYRVYLFRDFYAECGNEPVSGLDSKKNRELFCFLLINHDRPFTRERLADLLWQNSSPVRAKQYLRQTLWHLQSSFDKQSSAKCGLLSVEADWIKINLNSVLWVDVVDFEEAYVSAQSTEGRDLDDETALALQHAVTLYRGDLLENCYQEWCVFERERFQNMYLAMLDKLIGYFEASGNYDKGIDYSDRLLRMDVAHERTYRRRMRLYYLAGDRTTSLRQYQRCEKVLREELGVEPSQITKTLLRQIRSDELFAPLPPSTSSKDQRVEESSNRFLGLTQLNRDIIFAQRRLEQQIDALKSVLTENLPR